MLTHKKVNVISKKGLPLHFLKINTSLVYNIILPLSDIFTAIQMDCIVEEETKNGKVVLDINNFDRDFNEQLVDISYNDEDKIDDINIRTISTLDLEPGVNIIKIQENKNSLINRLVKEQNIVKNKKYR